MFCLRRGPALLRPVMRMVLRRQIGRQATAQGLQRLPLDLLVDELARRFDELEVWLERRPFFFAQVSSLKSSAGLARSRGWSR